MIKLRTKHIIYIVVGILILGILYALKNTSYFVRAAGFTTFVILFYIFDMTFNTNFKVRHYILAISISTFTVLFSPFYTTSVIYDKFLHLIVPILICYIIFYATGRLKLSFSLRLFFTFTSMVMLVTMHEVGEYILDNLFDWKLQGVYIRDYSEVAKLNLVMDKNDDTMVDTMLSTFGALIFVIIKISVKYYKKYKRK